MKINKKEGYLFLSLEVKNWSILKTMVLASEILHKLFPFEIP